MTEPPGGTFPPSRPASCSRTPQAFEASLTAVALSHPLPLHKSETHPTLTPLGKCQNTSSSSPNKPSSTLISRRAHSAVSLCLCFAKTEEVAHKLLGPSLVADRAGIFVQVAERGNLVPVQIARTCEGPVHLSSQIAG